MKEKYEERLRGLQSEYEAGQTMSRISGAIEVLKELLTESGGSVEEG